MAARQVRLPRRHIRELVPYRTRGRPEATLEDVGVAFFARREGLVLGEHLGLAPRRYEMPRLVRAGLRQPLKRMVRLQRHAAVQARSFESLATSIGSLFEDDRFATIEASAREVRETVLSLASVPMRQAEGEIAEGVVARRAIAIESPAAPPEAERAATDVLVAREIARIDLGVDLLVAQPPKIGAVP